MSSTIFDVGPFTVTVGVRPDNPSFACYIICRGTKLIGKQFSYPSLTDCQWFEKQKGVYADRSENATQAYGWTASTARRRGRQRKEDSERELKEAIEAG